MPMLERKLVGIVIHPLFLVFQSITWWLDTSATVHICSNTTLFSFYWIARDSFVMMGNGSHATTIHCVFVLAQSI